MASTATAVRLPRSTSASQPMLASAVKISSANPTRSSRMATYKIPANLTPPEVDQTTGLPVQPATKLQSIATEMGIKTSMPSATELADRLRPPAVLVLGPSGAGKTTSIVTYLLAGIETFVFVTEATGVDSLLDACRRYRAPIDLLHWHVITPTTAGWDALKKMVVTVRAMSYEDVTKIKSGVGKEHQRKLDELLDNCVDFHCQRTGRRYGDVTTWGDNRAFGIDSLSGLNMITMAHTIGLKPAAHQGEWGIAMNVEEQLIVKLVSDRAAHFFLMAHIDRIVDEITTTSRITAAALGNKLAPRLARWFSEIPLAVRKGKDFYWSTEDMQTDVKNRALEISSTLPQSFVPIVEFHRARKAQIEAEMANVPQP